MFSFTGAILGFVLFNMPKNALFGIMGGTAGKVVYTFFNNK
jgi:hypothetical protein